MLIVLPNLLWQVHNDPIYLIQIRLDDRLVASLCDDATRMVSFCGGSATPSSYPTDDYMEKLLGIDPMGGTDPLSPSVIWVGDRRNFTETRWLNLRLAVTAQTDWLTVFGRINSPFQWHGNHAFADAFSLVRAPTAYFVNSPARISDTCTVHEHLEQFRPWRPWAIGAFSRVHGRWRQENTSQVDRNDVSRLMLSVRQVSGHYTNF